jgi:hypothetical protein
MAEGDVSPAPNDPAALGKDAATVGGSTTDVRPWPSLDAIKFASE